MKPRTFTDAQFLEAFKNSTSIAQILVKLNLKPAGGNYKTIKNLIEKHNLDKSQLKGQAHSKGVKLGPKRPLSYYLVEGSSIQSYQLKLRLLKEDIFQHVCSNCKLETWLNGVIPLELDHINGVNSDNRLENLRLLCPNCHALTPTYRGRNKSKT